MLCMCKQQSIEMYFGVSDLNNRDTLHINTLLKTLPYNCIWYILYVHACMPLFHDLTPRSLYSAGPIIQNQPGWQVRSVSLQYPLCPSHKSSCSDQLLSRLSVWRSERSPKRERQLGQIQQHTNGWEREEGSGVLQYSGAWMKHCNSRWSDGGCNPILHGCGRGRVRLSSCCSSGDDNKRTHNSCGSKWKYIGGFTGNEECRIQSEFSKDGVNRLGVNQTSGECVHDGAYT